MAKIPYASAVGSLMYAMLCTRPDICYAVGNVSRYQSNPGHEHWNAVKYILKYLKSTRNLVLVYKGGALNPIGYIDSDFQASLEDSKSTSGMVFTLGGGAVVWRSAKQTVISDSTMEAEYIAEAEAAKELVWLRKFFTSIGVVPGMEKPLVLLCDNNGAIVLQQENHAHKTLHISQAPSGLPPATTSHHYTPAASKNKQHKPTSIGSGTLDPIPAASTPGKTNLVLQILVQHQHHKKLFLLILALQRPNQKPLNKKITTWM
ncbi:secreted RxLR effector protein 161-like [Cannabis sativa]|uniref:secreted RxLR effector protein 161-like n=1 Tax=Cannabis sativa TaxID=3483 RepID=UPI0029CA3FCA|nr:secreted RxLR effector protein 161-like [Cannabis sativa]